MNPRAWICAAITASVLATTFGCVASIGNRSAPPKTTVHDASGDFRIETVRLDDGGWALLKYRPDTGEAWYSDGPDNATWIPIQDTDHVRSSHFVFEPRTTGGPGWTVIRLDTRSGRTWITRNSVWVEVQDPQDQDPQDQESSDRDQPDNAS